MPVDMNTAANNPLIPKPTNFVGIGSMQGGLNQQTVTQEQGAAVAMDAERRAAESALVASNKALETARAALQKKRDEKTKVEGEKSTLQAEVAAQETALGNLKSQLGSIVVPTAVAVPVQTAPIPAPVYDVPSYTPPPPPVAPTGSWQSITVAPPAPQFAQAQMTIGQMSPEGSVVTKRKGDTLGALAPGLRWEIIGRGSEPDSAQYKVVRNSPVVWGNAVLQSSSAAPVPVPVVNATPVASVPSNPKRNNSER